MRGFIAGLVAVMLVGLLAGSVHSAESSHYVCGIEGIKAATIPPPGFYFRQYHVFYDADEVIGPNGDKVMSIDLTVYAIVNRFIWVSEYQILGGNFGVDFIVPLQYTSYEVPSMGVDRKEFDIGDICFEPILSWHGDRWDLAVGPGVIAPTGAFHRNNPAKPGRDMWTGLFSVGGTYYIDAEKLWAASILARYEIHAERESMDIQAGDDVLFEFGISRKAGDYCEVGLVGYAQWQLTDDSGSDVTYDPHDHDRVIALGPEVFLVLEDSLFISGRLLWEFAVVDRTKGFMGVITLTKRF